MASRGDDAWRQRQQAPGKRADENARLTAEIQGVFHQHSGFHDFLRIHLELEAACLRVSRHRVARLMRRAESRAGIRKTFRPCRNGSSGSRGVGENPLQQDIRPSGPRPLLGWRHHRHPHQRRLACLAVWITLCSRRVVGWKRDHRMDAALVIEALNRAPGHPQVEPETLLIHSDQ